MQWEYLIEIPRKGQTDEIREHKRSLAERAEGREQNRISENDRLRQELENLRKKNDELERLHPILKFYGTRAKLIASFDLKKEAGYHLYVGDDCPQAPCFIFTMGRVTNDQVFLFLGGRWEGSMALAYNAIRFSLPLKKGCRTKLHMSRYEVDFVIEDDRYSDLRAGIGIFLYRTLL